jgi:peptide/nickel transport system permease protein
MSGLAGFKPVVLWTDAFLFLLLVMILAGILHARRSEPMRAAWRRVGERTSAMASGVLLLVFVCIGMLDSLHYRPALPPAAGADAQATIYSGEVHSALDALLANLKLQVEKTYSAPMATQLFAKETIDLAGGGQTRVFPRLTHGGSHLRDPPAELVTDAGRRVGQGLVAGLVLATAATMLAAALLGPRGNGFAAGLGRLMRGRTRLRWRAALVTLWLICSIAGVLAALGPWYHVLGTDKVGQDVLYLTLKSVRTALVIGSLTTLVLLPVAVGLGILAGYLGGWVDDAIQYVYTVLNSIPGVLLIAAAVLMMQVVIDSHPEWFSTAAERADARLLALCFILGLTSWTSLCRLLRGETLKLRELEYVQAARAVGVSTARILARHVLPNVMHLVLIAVVMDFSGLVLAEAVLSYVGIGVDPNTISFGTMINAARMELAREPAVWWSLVSAFVFMFALVLSANVFADAVRDAFDPRAA